MAKKPAKMIEYYEGEEDFLAPAEGLFSEGGEIGLVLDLETTGLQAGKDKIIEIGLVQFTFDKDSGNITSVVRRDDFLQDPGIPLPALIVELTGLTDAKLKGQSIDRKLVDKIIKESSVIIAHNAAFDRGFMHVEFPSSDNSFWACSKEDIPWRELGFDCRVLQHLCNDHGFYYEGHRAEIDCMALLKLVAQKPKKGGRTYFKELLDAAFLKELVVSADGAPFESKDILKSANFRWDATNKVWIKKIKEQQKPEIESIMKTVYKKGRTEHRYIELSSKRRFLE